MRALYIFLCIILYFNTCIWADSTINSAVTYEFSGGRLGDNIVSYAHALWVAHCCGIPLLYKQFQYSDQLKLHEIDPKFSPQMEKRFAHVKRIVTKADFQQISKTSKTLYVVPYFPESKVSILKERHPFDINWGDTQFVARIRQDISPRQALQLIPIPSNCVSVALHVRKGGGFDPNFLEHDVLRNGQKKASYADIGAPEKFACDEFFITQLKNILSLTGPCPVYVYIFTDDKNPEHLAQRYTKALGNPSNLIFDYRKSANSWNSNVLVDFFSMMRFDCIIRPDSHFSLMASHLGDQLVTIAATLLHWDHDRLIVDEADTAISPKFLQKIQQILALPKSN